MGTYDSVTQEKFHPNFNPAGKTAQGSKQASIDCPFLSAILQTFYGNHD